MAVARMEHPRAGGSRTRARELGPAGRGASRVVAVVLALVASGVTGRLPSAHAAATPVGRAGAVSGQATGVLVPAGLATDTYQSWHPAPAVDSAFSTPAIGDLYGDGNLEIVTGGMDGCVRVFGLAGGSPRVGCLYTGAGAVQASPVLVDWNGDGRLDVVAANNVNGQLFVFDPRTGQVLFWAQAPDYPGGGFFGTPAVADLNGDGQPDIVATCWCSHVYAWSHNGQMLWSRFVYDSIWSSAAVADLDADGRPEVVFGADMDYGNAANLPPINLAPGGVLWVLRADGSVQPGFPKSLPGQVIWSAPSVADLNGDGRLDVVVGTGNNFPAPAGQVVYAFDAQGNALPGWPVTIGGRAMGSPAVGDLDGDGKLDVAVQADDGRVYAIRYDGRVLWSTCNMSFSPCDGRIFAGVNGSASIAELDGDSRPEVVSAMEAGLRVFDGATGAILGDSSITWDCLGGQPSWVPETAPTITSAGGQAYVVLTLTDDFNHDGRRDAGDRQDTCIWRTGQPLGSGGWLTFKNNFRRTGTYLDTTPPVASITGPPNGTSQTTTKVTVSWSGTDTAAPNEVASGISTFDTQTEDGAGPWATWLTGAPATTTSAPLYGLPGHTYQMRVRATDRAGNVGAWSAPISVSFTSSATPAQPFRSLYAVSGWGSVNAADSPPTDSPSWPGWDVARGVAAIPGGGYVLDAWGGLHPFGTAPPVTGTGYWPGWDITRGVALNPDGTSGYVLDGWGGLHPVGGAAPPSLSGYWPGWDIARAVVLLPSSTAAAPAGYVLDGWGGVHPFGAAPPLACPSSYWPGWDIARGLSVSPDGNGTGYVLDGWGGLHACNGAPAPTGEPYWPGWDIARGVVQIRGGGGYSLDGFGGIHPFGGAPAVDQTRYWGFSIGRGLSIAA